LTMVSHLSRQNIEAAWLRVNLPATALTKHYGRAMI
jgi:hypothetical protein